MLYLTFVTVMLSSGQISFSLVLHIKMLAFWCCNWIRSNHINILKTMYEIRGTHLASKKSFDTIVHRHTHIYIIMSSLLRIFHGNNFHWTTRMTISKESGFHSINWRYTNDECTDRNLPFWQRAECYSSVEKHRQTY